MTNPIRLDDNLDDYISGAVSRDQRAVEHVLAAIRPLVLRYCRARVGRQERAFVSADDVAQEVCLAVLTALPGYRDQGRPFLAFVYGIAAHKVADAHRTAARDNKSAPIADIPDIPDRLAPDPEHQAVLTDELRLLGRTLDGRASRIGRSGVGDLLARSSFGTRGAETARAHSAGHSLDDRAAKLVAGILREQDLAAESDRTRTDLSTKMNTLLRMLPDKQREIVILRVIVGFSAEETAQAIGTTPGEVRVTQHDALAQLRTLYETEVTNARAG
ncbi:sigma-70 family RNA polymerase sigma factor [Actinokineospora terrae]|uniref:RNA polymerase sigma factor, sigma-70 family n=1 Tax=Actinokineospora terrae TaxID=155974 RepID=A0A1H9MN07_9PSEU|nr:sigma-70 family RNA polymerase sigma factor [Actinokineospora terrae]SER25090.1 RNA polymerase sigma factor, sigma-70 family [Actinokineospora terrae]